MSAPDNGDEFSHVLPPTAPPGAVDPSHVQALAQRIQNLAWQVNQLRKEVQEIKNATQGRLLTVEEYAAVRQELEATRRVAWFWAAIRKWVYWAASSAIFVYTFRDYIAQGLKKVF